MDISIKFISAARINQLSLENYDDSDEENSYYCKQTRNICAHIQEWLRENTSGNI
jgi:hypothetical protein